MGANAGTGIPLGDRCTIEAGLHITAGTPVTVKDEHGDVVRQIKARDWPATRTYCSSATLKPVR